MPEMTHQPANGEQVLMSAYRRWQSRQSEWRLLMAATKMQLHTGTQSSVCARSLMLSSLIAIFHYIDPSPACVAAQGLSRSLTKLAAAGNLPFALCVEVDYLAYFAKTHAQKQGMCGVMFKQSMMMGTNAAQVLVTGMMYASRQA